jgi:hypothetical protein
MPFHRAPGWGFGSGIRRPGKSRRATGVPRVCPKIVGQLLAVVLRSDQARQNWDTPGPSRGGKHAAERQNRGMAGAAPRRASERDRMAPLGEDPRAPVRPLAPRDDPVWGLPFLLPPPCLSSRCAARGRPCATGVRRVDLRPAAQPGGGGRGPAARFYGAPAGARALADGRPERPGRGGRSRLPPHRRPRADVGAKGGADHRLRGSPPSALPAERTGAGDGPHPGWALPRIPDPHRRLLRRPASPSRRAGIVPVFLPGPARRPVHRPGPPGRPRR